jgi:hypothetical protein
MALSRLPSLLRAWSRRAPHARVARAPLASAAAALVALWALAPGGSIGEPSAAGRALAAPAAASVTVHVGPGFSTSFSP